MKWAKRLDIDKFESNLINNVILKPEECVESFRRNNQIMKPRYVPAR